MIRTSDDLRNRITALRWETYLEWDSYLPFLLTWFHSKKLKKKLQNGKKLQD